VNKPCEKCSSATNQLMAASSPFYTCGDNMCCHYVPVASAKAYETLAVATRPAREALAAAQGPTLALMDGSTSLRDLIDDAMRYRKLATLPDQPWVKFNFTSGGMAPGVPIDPVNRKPFLDEALDSVKD
jgi:hypothetical protein